jgi:NADH-quinone oxidoreductase subunit J
MPETLLFYLFSGIAIVASLLVIGQRNPMYSIMLLIASFGALSGLYIQLDAPFVAMAQVIVYAGAIMVLFIFVVMILNREEISPVALRGLPIRIVGVVAALYLVFVFARVVSVGAEAGVPAPVPATFGTVGSIGDILFRDFLYPFEAISLLLLVAVVGGVVVSRSHKKEVAAELAAERRHAVEVMARADSPAELGPGDAGAHAHAGSGGHH